MAQWITHVVEMLGYLGVGFLMFIENVFPPIPSELIMPFAGFTSARGDLSFIGVVLAGTAGSVIGQLPLYYLGRLLGQQRIRRWADRYGKWLAVSGDDIDRANGWFERHGAMAVLLCRLVPGVRSLISIPAGFARMNLLWFTLYSTIGMGVWAGVLAFVGRLLGANYEAVEKFLGPVTYVVIGVLVAGVIGWIVWRKLTQRQAR